MKNKEKLTKCDFRLTEHHITHKCSKPAKIQLLFSNFCTDHYQQWQVMTNIEERIKERI